MYVGATVGATAGVDDHNNSWRLRIRMPLGLEFKLGDAFDRKTSAIFNQELRR